MRFSRRRIDEPEINLIPFIDVLLVVIIFLMLSTTYARYTALRVDLPRADADALADSSSQLVVAVGSDGRYAVDGRVVDAHDVDAFAATLAAAAATRRDAVVVVSADSLATHQAVLHVLDAARRAGLARLTFAAQAPSASTVPAAPR